MNSKIALALFLTCGWFCSFAGSGFGYISANDDFQSETEINSAEKAASDALLPAANWTNEVPWIALDRALENLDRHYSRWGTNASIPPRLSQAVLTVFPSLTNASVDPHLKGQMWCNAVRMLGLTHDPAMLPLLRPYLENTTMANDPGGLGAGLTTMRVCDDAAMAINSLLNLKLQFPHSRMFIFPVQVLTNGSQFTIWKSHSPAAINDWSGSDPQWKEWDQKIVELEQILDPPAGRR